MAIVELPRVRDTERALKQANLAENLVRISNNA
jgi:hypothetical protein